MAKALLFAMVAACVLMGCCHAKDAWKSDAKVIKVGGKVMCQDCNQGWNEWAHPSTPLQANIRCMAAGCKVGITCMDRGRVVYYASDETDEEGGYEMSLSKFINGKELNWEDCKVRLMSSPHPQCNLLTNFGHGRTGVNLSRPNLIYRNSIKYLLDPFYFTSPMCEEPDTSSSTDQEPMDEGSNY
ncbi:hypothetical protein ACLOJK_015865 [Asimina triloba]